MNLFNNLKIHQGYKLNISLIFVFIISSFGSSCQTTDSSIANNDWEKSFYCAKGLLEANYIGSGIDKITESCIIVEQGDLLLFYTPRNVITTKSSSVFTSEEPKICRKAFYSKPSSVFKHSEDKLIKILKLQFNLDQLKPHDFENALAYYNKPFTKYLDLCIDDHFSNKQLITFNNNVGSIIKHAKFLSEKRKNSTSRLRSKYTIKTLKRIRSNYWKLVVKVSIVNNGDTPFQFATTCDNATAYSTASKNVFIVKEQCSDNRLDITSIAPKGVIRDELVIFINSNERPTGKSIDLYFGAAPSYNLGTVKIPPKASS